MAGRIPQDFIDDLLTRIDVVDVVDAYVPLKRAGKNHQACCPFHEEKTPSFTVSQEKQFYHCFGCGANGTAISFLMEYGGMGFIEAVEDLAHRVGLELPRQEGERVQSHNQTSELYELMELVVSYFRKQLKEHPQAETAVNYLKSRGLTGELAACYELGYAPPGWDNLLKKMGHSDAAKGRLEKLGLLLKKDQGGHYDRFRDRIMFPIRDHRGRAIGFGGRVMGDDTPKYLNSPETPIFHKGRELYGLYQARKKIRDLERIYIVEGYMDVLALAQFEIYNSVATLGTAATTEHLDKLFRHSSELVFCFDGDTAGRKAAWRAMELTLPVLKEGRTAWFRFMPQGDDPDSFVRKHGRENFEDSQQMVPLSDYMLSELKNTVDMKTREGRARLIEDALPYLKRLPPSAFRELLLQDLAQLGQIEINTLKNMAQNSKEAPSVPLRKAARRPQNPALSPVRKAIRLLLNYPTLHQLIEDKTELNKVGQHGIPFLIELVDFIRQRDKTTTANILEHWRDTKYDKHIRDLIQDEETIQEPELIQQQFSEIISRLIDSQKHDDRLQQLRSVKDTEELKSLYSTPSKSETD